MKAVIALTFIIIVLIAAVLGILTITNVLTLDRSADLFFKSSAIIGVLAVACMIVAMIGRHKGSSADEKAEDES